MVPVARYFVYVGSVLVALLFVANWMWPSSDPVPGQDAAAQAAVDAPIARIHSAQKWPDKIEFDTSKPTIVPPPAPVIAETAPPAATVATNAAPASPLVARAEVKPNVQPAPAPQRKRVARVHHRNYPRQTTSTWADANPNPRPWSWSWNW